ncbi:acyl-CoA dehydrogenase family protein [Frankia sp. CNm7]|uniref:Acyl-CoA dehydrogenase family protein n=1 Tax=Frankia nepalensis TaxID=1836974 RepID=A0A937UVC9_9ACTN|nr:acyl-CoA dehydrogenase family protein [Frankia nepalensis]MBL7499146.1 acyl-CoA dehydrogenase family protein [Frankia nepalensis]MBL7511036.1 acyl-CoA dehydrogenase family protein [Frankia nepalensis]MBL7520496.1 acyl-CoA dehydrogenase family protein [Frankia nepalensis]MBL7632116.1 acyl-CoA dehydrogenase family protein [Frankia nepalensis]
MDFRFAPEQEEFRAQVRAFVESELPVEWERIDPEGERAWEITCEFQRKLADKKWLAMAWPPALGGLGADLLTQLIYHETMDYYHAPAFTMAVAWVGPAVMLYGNEEQKARLLPRMATGEDVYCTLYSEPGAGSDLAAMQTKAVLDGDDYVITGQKVWTSGAHHANLGWLAARTDPTASKHRGLSTFVVDVDSPGLTVRPLINMAGQHAFNEVFFDGVRVPKANLIGEPGRGWYNIATALEFERSGIEWIAKARRRLDQIIAHVREHRDILENNPQLRFELADRAIEVEVGTLLCYRTIHLAIQGKAMTYEASASKVYNSELTQRVAQTGMKVFGPYAGLGRDDPRSPLTGQLTHSIQSGYLWTFANTIGAGSSEIQRNIIASRGLGLPR